MLGRMFFASALLLTPFAWVPSLQQGTFNEVTALQKIGGNAECYLEENDLICDAQIGLWSCTDHACIEVNKVWQCPSNKFQTIVKTDGFMTECISAGENEPGQEDCFQTDPASCELAFICGPVYNQPGSTGCIFVVGQGMRCTNSGLQQSLGGGTATPHVLLGPTCVGSLDPGEEEEEW